MNLLKCTLDIVGQFSETRTTDDLRKIAERLLEAAGEIDAEMSAHEGKQLVCKPWLAEGGSLCGISFYAAEVVPPTDPKVALQEQLARSAARKDRIKFRQKRARQLEDSIREDIEDI